MKLPARSEVDERYTWRLEDMIASDDQWEGTFARARDGIESLSAFSGKLGDSPQSLKAALNAQNRAALNIERLYVYAHMRKDEDNARPLYQGMADRAAGLSARFSGAVSYIVPEIMQIPPDVLERWSTLSELSSYAHMLHDLARGRAHTLSHAEENLLALVSEVTSAPRTIFKMLDNADISFPSVTTPRGDEEISHGSFIRMMQSSDRELRKEIYTKFYTTYDGLKNTYAASLSSSVKSNVFYARARRFPSALEASLFADNVPVSVYDNLIDSIHERLPSLHRYMDLRARSLKLDKTRMYDLYAPLSAAEYDIGYEQAQELVIDALKPLGAEYAATLKEAFASRWVDVYENRGKSSGAYCWGCYGTHPYVLLNYQPNIDNAFTIAHEMGHAMHSYYSDGAQEYHNAQYAILVAEVASTVNEALMIDHLLRSQNDPALKLRLINYYLEQFRTTVFRQVMFAEFEKLIHAMEERGEPLTAHSLSETYLKLNNDYYGANVDVDPLIGMEWARISHFYNAFYVYKYATGFSAAIAISRDIREQGHNAVARYMEFLKSGGKDYPLKLLKRVGVDLTKNTPVLRALDIFDATLNELEALI